MIGDAHLTSQWSGGVKLLRPSRSYSNINRLCADVNVTSQLAVSLAVNTLQAVTLNTEQMGMLRVVLFTYASVPHKFEDEVVEHAADWNQ